MSDLDPIADRYRRFAAAVHGQSDCFERWATSIAADDAVLRWVATLPKDKQQPNLVFAAARWHGVPAPGPYDGLREALLGDDGTIRATIRNRSTQTNEVGRLATLVPVFAELARTRPGPLALLEVGASAGLCLFPDRYDYEWRPLGRLTGTGGPQLRCDVTGPLPVPTAHLEVGWRAGIDLHPLDVADEDAMAWLSTLIWPEQHERRERLQAAIAVARQDPPALVTGDLVELLPAQVAAAAGSGQVVVFHSAVIAYLADPERQAFQALMRELVAAGTCRWVSNEDPGVLPDVTRTAPGTSPPEGGYVLGVDGRAVAWTHQHGATMTWW